MSGIDRVFCTPTVVVDQDKYDELIAIKDRYERAGCKIKNNNLSFGDAINLLKQGKKLQREGWNGKGQYIELATNISYKNNNDEIINSEHDAIGNKAIAFVGTSGIQLGWLASQADMLADDWEIIESEEK